MNFENEDQDVQAALRNFRASVFAWSEQEMARPRQMQPVRAGGVSCYDLARDLAGAVKGLPKDLADNPKYMRGFGE